MSRDQMRVVHLTTVHNPRDNRIFNKECAALAEAGFDITLMATNAGDESVNGIRMVNLEPTKSRLGRLTIKQRQAWRELKKIQPHVLHTHDPECIPLVLAWKAAHRGRVKVIYDAHEDLVGQIADKRYMKAPVKAAARLYARLVLMMANHLCDAVVVATPIIEKQWTNPSVTVVRNYPWLKDYPQYSEDGRDEVAGRVVYVGGLTQGRQFDEMVDATLAVDGATFVCAGPPSDTAKRRIDALAGDERFDYRGVIGPKEVPDLLSTAAAGQVFLEPLPNYRESLPTKLFEYMAAGVPFVASDFPYWRQLFGPADAGVFVDTSDVPASAKVIGELLADDERRAQMGRNGRRAIETEFNFERDAPLLVDLTESLASQVR